MLRADFHCHTIHSYDSSTGVDQLIKRCLKVGINCLAVTDHNEIDGALKVRDRAPFKIIIGEEIFTAEGEIIGLFLKKRISPGLPLRETICRIKDQGGIVYLPHPVSGLRKSKLSPQVIMDNAGLIDIVELHNSRTRTEGEAEIEWVRKFISDNNLVAAAASDAHSVWELGNVIVELNDFESHQEFLENLVAARITFRKSPLWVRVVMNHRVRKCLRRMKADEV